MAALVILGLICLAQLTAFTVFIRWMNRERREERYQWDRERSRLLTRISHPEYPVPPEPLERPNIEPVEEDEYDEVGTIDLSENGNA